MHPFHILLALYVILSLVAFAFLLRWERRYFLQRGKVRAWLQLRLASIPIALALTGIVILSSRGISGMEALAFFYFFILPIAPVFWFGAHWIVGKLVRPSIGFGESAMIAGSPIALCLVLTIVAHKLQPIVWSMLVLAGKA